MAEPRRLCVIGHPVAHSRSPQMHNAALAALGLGDRYAYEAIDLPPDEFDGLVPALEDEGFVGANVTIPHKQTALRLAHEASEVATQIGAANTLSFEHGVIRADNTDAQGTLDAIGDHPAGARVLVLGAGGAARAAVWALATQGAAVEIWNRTSARAEELVAELGEARPETIGPRLSAVPSDAELPVEAYDIVVNTTPVGMALAASSVKSLPIDADHLQQNHIVVDLTYGDQDSELITAARSTGARTVDGIAVLAHQGAASLRIWTGCDPPLDVMLLAARRPPAT